MTEQTESQKRISQKLKEQGFNYDSNCSNSGLLGLFFFDVSKDALVAESRFSFANTREEIRRFNSYSDIDNHLNGSSGDEIRVGILSARVAPVSADGMTYGNFVEGVTYRRGWSREGGIE
jgi:hypothetical protein